MITRTTSHSEHCNASKRKRKIKIILWLPIGRSYTYDSIVIKFGCSLGGETIPKNRTKEQYNWNVFEPYVWIFGKRQRAKIKLYKNSIYIESGNVKGHKVFRYFSQSDITEYTIKIRWAKKQFLLLLPNGRLQYESKLEPLFDEEILNLQIKRLFRFLEYKETLKEVELNWAILSTHHSDLYKYLKNK